MERQFEITHRLRDQLAAFITRREKAYKAILAKGQAVPDLALKEKAIANLRAQLEASKDWTLRSHILWILALRHQIAELLPYEFHDDPKQVKYRQRIIDMLRWCDDQIGTKQLTFNLKAA